MKRSFMLLTIIAVMAMLSCDRESEPFTFVQLCDPQLGFGGYAHDSMALVQAVLQINTLNPDFVVVCGDLVHNPGDKVYSDFKSIISALEMPCYLAAGNHDMGSSSGQPEVDSLFYYRNVMGEDYYKFSYNDCQFVVVNTSLWADPVAGETENQDEWLKGALAEVDPDDCLVVVAHHQLFNNSPSETDPKAPIEDRIRDELMTLYMDAGMDIYLHGHTHTTSAKEIEGVKYVSGETTSVNFDQRPFGFTLWEMSDTSSTHTFVRLDTNYSVQQTGEGVGM